MKSKPIKRVTSVPRHLEALAHASQHRREILESTLCGCFACEQTFPPGAITRWKDLIKGIGQTACCPFCGATSVLGDKAGFPLTQRFLKKMQGYWY